MNKAIRSLVAVGVSLASAFGVAALSAEEFTIQIGDTVSDDAPGSGAGRIEASTATDIYTFAGTAGQSVFVEELSVASAFAGWLRWEMRTPGGASVFSSYLEGTHEGRRTLPETGNYTLRVWVGANNPLYVGTYSFRLRAIPADPVFPIQLGDTISEGVPGAGAGNIEEPGAQDLYTFDATAGQHVFLEAIAAAGTFQGWLYWELRSPSSNLVSGSFLKAGGHPGRRTLPETGTYTIRVYVNAKGISQVGSYSIRLRVVPADQTFEIQPGDTVASGDPAAGAGNIEVPGAQDLYTFQGTAGQSVFFESISAAPAFGGWLQWEARTPGGQSLFSSYFGDVGRKTLPETGTYTIRFWVGANEPSYVGAYSFHLNSLPGDARYAIEIGAPVSEGTPGRGAGRIEEAGGQDFYTFDGVAGQKVMFEPISVDAKFEGWLRWEVKTPGGSSLFADYLKPGSIESRTLPETGTYSIRLADSTTNPQHVGFYSFRLYCEVVAGRDNLATLPSTALTVPIGKFLCNDTHEIGDVLEVDMPSGASAQGGTLTNTPTAILYAPKAGFVGIDTFAYRIRGHFGGEDTAVVTVRVGVEADQVATVVSLVREGVSSVMVCLLGAPNQVYDVDQSDDLFTWTQVGTVTADDAGSMTYSYLIDPTVATRYHRFRRP